MTTITAAEPYGCRWCGDARHHHGQQWTPGHGLHGWEPPTNHLIKTRMRRRLAARRSQRAARATIRYHATANWSGSYQPDDEGDMYCADCLRSDCPRFWRIQRHLDRIRWPQPRREPFPF